MGRIKNYDSFKQDSLLFEFMKKHKGKENIVSSREISRFMNENGFPIKCDSINGKIRRIMYQRNAPICHINANGYYWATSREEILQTISDIESRISSLKEHIEHLKSFIIE